MTDMHIIPVSVYPSILVSWSLDHNVLTLKGHIVRSLIILQINYEAVNSENLMQTEEWNDIDTVLQM